jgi:hypothetical protein
MTRKTESRIKDRDQQFKKNSTETDKTGVLVKRTWDKIKIKDNLVELGTSQDKNIETGPDWSEFYKSILACF